MTLQQKIAAKQSKKGFTLVELVVVIAILAILAAIAIPAVIGIISSASQSSTETDAATIDGACKDYHAALTGGTVNDTNKPSALSAYTLPSANDSNKNRTQYANNTASVQEAMEWNGIWDGLKDKVTGGDFGYKDGSVCAAIDGDGNAVAGVTPISGSETLGTVLNR